MTLEEFEQLPDAAGIQELLDGRLVAMPPPKRRHSEIHKFVARLLSSHVHESRIWAETGFLIGAHCLQPDVAVIAPNQQTERGWYAGAPLIAIEVASRGNTKEELLRNTRTTDSLRRYGTACFSIVWGRAFAACALAWKTERYLEHGAREVWVMDDVTHSVAVHQRGVAVRSYDRSFVSAALGVPISVGDLFGLG